MIGCKNSDPNLAFLFQNAVCVEKANTFIQGDPKLNRGTSVWMTLQYNPCIFNANCTGQVQQKIDNLNAIISEKGKKLILQMFTQEIFLDFENYKETFKTKTKIITTQELDFTKNATLLPSYISSAMI